MRYLIAILTVLVLSIGVFGAEVNLNLDRCIILNDNTDNSAPSKIAIHFNLPDSLIGKEMIYAELSGWLALHSDGTDSLFELRFYPFLSEMPQEEPDYQDLEAITDSMSCGVYTIRLGDSSAFHVDITSFLMKLSNRENTNYGLVGTADLLGDNNIKLPEALGDSLRERLTVRLIYK